MSKITDHGAAMSKRINHWLNDGWRAWINTMARLLCIVRGLFAGRPQPVQSDTRRRLPIKPRFQLTTYSCTASVMQMVADHFGCGISHRKAIQLTRCRPNGATLGDVAAAFRKLGRYRVKRHRTRGSIRRALREGRPVMAGDLNAKAGTHAILITGFTNLGFWIADPATGSHHWRSERRVLADSDEFVSVRPIGHVSNQRLSAKPAKSAK